MNKTWWHKKEILRLLRENKEYGVNSKVLINNVTPRYSARINDLKKEGYHFRTQREQLGGSNFIRIWLVEVQKPKIVRWEYVGNTARAIYG